MLATAGIGAIWSSCAPEFGVSSVVDRFAQIEPKVLVAVDGYRYGGAWHDRRDALAEIRRRLPTLEATVLVGNGATAANDTVTWDRLPGGRARAGPALGAGGLRPSAVGPVLLGHHRAAQGDRPRARRDRPGAAQVDLSAPGPGPDRPLLLVHHHPLGEVGPPGLRASCCV